MADDWGRALVMLVSSSSSSSGRSEDLPVLSIRSSHSFVLGLNPDGISDDEILVLVSEAVTDNALPVDTEGGRAWLAAETDADATEVECWWFVFSLPILN